MIVIKQLLDVCRLLNAAGVQYVLVGGWAVFIHGYERTTRDIDLIVNSDTQNIKKLKSALSGLLPDACSELELDDLRNNIVVRMAGEDIVVDLMAKIGSIDYTAAIDGAVTEEIDGVKIPVPDVDTMLELKGGLRGVDKKDYMFLLGKREYLKRKARK